MPIYAPSDTLKALGNGLKYCESRTLQRDKFNLFDSGLDAEKRVSLDLYLPNGRADIESIRTEWSDAKAKQERKRDEGKSVNERELENCISALEKTRSFDLSYNATPKVYTQKRSWLDILNPDRVIKFKLTTASRLLVGLANGTLENAGCTLHPRLGFPVIPGSALKGVARDAAAALNLSHELESCIFGNQVEEKENFRQGDVCFLDAFALVESGTPDLELDILTPHYQKYYKQTENQKALDEESPIPNVFPAVCAGITFEFALVATTLRLNDGQARKHLESAATCLKHALIHHGVGAKTAAGYGYFQEADRKMSFSTDLFPPPVLSLSEKWTGKTKNTFKLKELIKDLSQVTDTKELAAYFDQIMPAEHLSNFRSANPYWAAFLREGGKAILEKINRPLPRS